MVPELAFQTYTVRNDMLVDFERTLSRIAAIGYRNIELHTLGGHDPRHVRSLCDRLQLSIVSEMASLDDLMAAPETYIDHAGLLGHRHLVCPGLAAERRNAEGYAWAASQLRRLGDVMSERGVTLCYHNHAFEFDPLPTGETGFDLLLRHAFSSTVRSELDVYWVAYANRDPLTVMDQLRGRLPLLHLKDMAGDGSRGFAEIGGGVMNLQAIVDKATAIGVKYLIVEQDSNWQESPLASAAVSFRSAAAMM